MNPLHLLWIVPVSATMGAFCMALVAAMNNRQCEDCHTRCLDCVWYAPIDSNHTAKEIHTEDRPGLTRPDGFCHRAEKSKL